MNPNDRNAAASCDYRTDQILFIQLFTCVLRTKKE